MRWVAVFALLCLPARALAEEPREERVPLRENFSRIEIWGIAGVAAVDLVLFGLQGEIVERLNPPLIGEPPALDRDISDALDRPGTDQWLAGVPDVLGGVVAPVAAFAWYGVDAAALWIRGRSLSGDANADHELLALMQGFGLMAGLSQAIKFAVGRERPDHALRDVPIEGDEEAFLSFWSLHAGSSFTLAAFVHRDLSDYLVSGPLAGCSPGRRAFAGRVLPALALYGTAGVIGLSRIIDQRHYFTDVLLGALVGTAAGNLFYYIHFDGRGRPRRAGGDVQVVAFPGGLGVAGRF